MVRIENIKIVNRKPISTNNNT